MLSGLISYFSEVDLSAFDDTADDFLLAQMLQKQFNDEYDQGLKLQVVSSTCVMATILREVSKCPSDIKVTPVTETSFFADVEVSEWSNALALRAAKGAFLPRL